MLLLDREVELELLRLELLDVTEAAVLLLLELLLDVTEAAVLLLLLEDETDAAVLLLERLVLEDEESELLLEVSEATVELLLELELAEDELLVGAASEELLLELDVKDASVELLLLTELLLERLELLLELFSELLLDRLELESELELLRATRHLHDPYAAPRLWRSNLINELPRATRLPDLAPCLVDGRTLEHDVMEPDQACVPLHPVKITHDMAMKVPGVDEHRVESLPVQMQILAVQMPKLHRAEPVTVSAELAQPGAGSHIAPHAPAVARHRGPQVGVGRHPTPARAHTDLEVASDVALSHQDQERGELLRVLHDPDAGSAPPIAKQPAMRSKHARHVVHVLKAVVIRLKLLVYLPRFHHGLPGGLVREFRKLLSLSKTPIFPSMFATSFCNSILSTSNCFFIPSTAATNSSSCLCVRSRSLGREAYGAA